MSRETEFMANKLKTWPGRVGASTSGSSSSFGQHKTIGVLKDTLLPDEQSRGDKDDLEYRNLPIQLAWICRTPDGFRAVLTGIKYNPETVDGDFSEISKLFKRLVPEISSMMLRSDNIFIDNNRPTKQPIIVEDLYADGGLVVDDGEYTVMAKDNSIYAGYVFNKVMDFAGKTVGARIWTDGDRFAFQDLIAGDPAREELPTKFTSKPASGLWGTFGFMDGEAMNVMLPFKVKGVSADNYRNTITGHTIFGNTISIVITPNLKRPVTATGIKNDEIGEHMNANIYYIPESYKFFNLGSDRIDLIGDVQDLRRRQIQVYQAVTSGIKLDAHNRFGDVDSNNFFVRFDADGGYGFDGHIMDRFGSKEMDNVPQNRAIWLLMNLGFSEGGARYVLNRAQALQKVTVAGGRRPEI